MCVMKLLFDSNYLFSLTMVLAVGWTSTTAAQTEERRNHHVDLTVKPTGPTAVRVEWTPPPPQQPSSYAGGGPRCLLTYSAAGRAGRGVELADGRNVTLAELSECTAYAIAVTCAYGTGERLRFGPSASTTWSTSHVSPLNAVEDLTAGTSGGSALIAWRNPAEQQPCVAHRLVSWALSGTDAVVAVEKLGAEAAHWRSTAASLEPCGAYHGNVTAVDFAGDRGSPAPFRFTADFEIPGPVSKLSAISYDSQSISVSWAKPLNAHLCIHRYEVVYCHDAFVCSALSTQVNSLTITALKPCVTYQITVTPKVADTVNGLSVKTEATVIAEAMSKPKNGRALFLTNYTATLQWDPPTSVSCSLVYQTVNCSCANTTLEVTNNHTGRVVIEDLKPFTKCTCYSTFFTNESVSAKSDELVFWTKMKVPDPPTNLTAKRVSSRRATLTWAPPAATSPGVVIGGYRWTVTFVSHSHPVPKHCGAATHAAEDGGATTYYYYAQKEDDYHHEHEIGGLRPSSVYSVELSASTESGFGGSANVTIRTPPSVSSMVVDLNATSVQSNSVVLSWKYPCEPNGQVAFFHCVFVGERTGHHNHIFSTTRNVSDNETEFVYNLTDVLPEYKYVGTVAAINYNVDNPGYETGVRFVTPSTSPELPRKLETHNRLRVIKMHLTHVLVSVPDDLFSNANGNVKYYSIIVYQDGGFPDVPERGVDANSGCERRQVWPPVARTWSQAAPYPFILAYQTTPDQWMPFTKQKDTVIFDIGADESCRINDEKKYCNGPLRPVTDYRLKLRAFTEHGYQDSWTVPFTTPGESTAVYYLVLCSVLFAVLITVSRMCCMLNERVPWAVKYNRPTETLATDADFPGNMNAKQLLTKSPQEMEAEFNLLTMHVKFNPSTAVATMPQNKFKNRYINTLPYDFNRVIIKSCDSDYVNASFIEDSNGVLRYIACQGPMRNTCIDMWQMILDQNVASIVMLCRTTENDKVKCEQYFPNSKEKLIFGDIQVKNDMMIVDKNHSFTTRILTVHKGNVKKTIRHFQFHDWPDFGTPSAHSTLLEFCLMVQAKSPTGLTVVHCSAGVGRTGTYIACDMLLRQALQDNTKFNIFKTVLKLREQRANMVQTQAQYEFVYGLLRYYTQQYSQRKSLGPAEKRSLDDSAASV